MCYIPLCKSSDPFRCVLQTLPGECHAFSTKARVPALVLFELEEHPRGADVATFTSVEMESIYENPQSQGDGATEQTLSRFRPNEGGNIWRKDDDNVLVERIIQGVIQFVLVHKAPSDEVLNHAIENPVTSFANGASVCIGPNSETFAERCTRLREASVLGKIPSWRLGGLIAKSNDDLRQEVFVMQLIGVYKRIFASSMLPLWLYTYRILSTSKTTGLIELITDCISLDGLKKKEDYPGSLRLHFENSFKEKAADAVEEFVKSMAAYSIVTYVLAIKDR